MLSDRNSAFAGCLIMAVEDRRPSGGPLRPIGWVEANVTVDNPLTGIADRAFDNHNAFLALASASVRNEQQEDQTHEVVASPQAPRPVGAGDAGGGNVVASGQGHESTHHRYL